MEKFYSLGAYQVLTIERMDLGEQFNDGPNAAMARLRTPMDEKFINRTVTALLTEEAQWEIISAFQDNLRGF